MHNQTAFKCSAPAHANYVPRQQKSSNPFKKMSASNPCKDDVAKSSSPQSEAMASAGRQRQQLPGLV